MAVSVQVVSEVVPQRDSLKALPPGLVCSPVVGAAAGCFDYRFLNWCSAWLPSRLLVQSMGLNLKRMQPHIVLGLDTIPY